MKPTVSVVIPAHDEAGVIGANLDALLAGALRRGDAAGRVFPRVYLDADVRLDAASVRALADAASRPGVLACAPVPEWDLAGVGRFVRRVHRVHDRLIAPSRALAGVGVY